MNKQLKNRVYSKCRYWHFNVSGVLSNPEKHTTYLDILDTMDYWFGTDTWNDDKNDINEAWKIALANLNKCTFSKLEYIENRFIGLSK